MAAPGGPGHRTSSPFGYYYGGIGGQGGDGVDLTQGGDVLVETGVVYGGTGGHGGDIHVLGAGGVGGTGGAGVRLGGGGTVINSGAIIGGAGGIGGGHVDPAVGDYLAGGGAGGAGVATLAGTLGVEGTLDLGGKLLGARRTALVIDGGTLNVTAGGCSVCRRLPCRARRR